MFCFLDRFEDSEQPCASINRIALNGDSYLLVADYLWCVVLNCRCRHMKEIRRWARSASSGLERYVSCSRTQITLESTVSLLICRGIASTSLDYMQYHGFAKSCLTIIFLYMYIIANLFHSQFCFRYFNLFLNCYTY